MQLAWLPLIALISACGQGGDTRQNESSAQNGPASGSATIAKTYEGPKPEGVSSPNDVFTRTYYIPAAASSDMYEIEASRLALKRGSRPEVKAFAQQMIDDHGKTTKALSAFVASHPVNVAIPSHMNARHQAMMENLENSSAKEFDEVYIGQQAAAHQEALNLHKSYASNGDDKALGAVAKSTAGVVEHHAATLQKLEQALGAGHSTAG